MRKTPQEKQHLEQFFARYLFFPGRKVTFASVLEVERLDDAYQSLVVASAATTNNVTGTRR
jgi:hypothetical protein